MGKELAVSTCDRACTSGCFFTSSPSLLPPILASPEKESLISEIAVSADASTIASGDRNGNIHLHDTMTAVISGHVTVENECLSIKTSESFQGAYNICSGLEAPSKFTVLDPRGTDATLEFQSTLGGLLTSSQLSEHHVLLGFENSALHCIDLRYPEKPLYKNYDPYVQAVGHIEFNDDKSMFVVSGLTDYTVYSRDTAGTFRPTASESGAHNIGCNTDGYATNAIFVARRKIFCTNSKAGVSINDV